MNLTAAQVAAHMAADIRGICQRLLPDGVERSGEWCVGSVAGEKGNSLKVRLSGPKAGTWKDFADDSTGGDALDLWAAVYGQSIGEALADACDYLGLKRPQFEGSKPKRVSIKPPKGTAKAQADERVRSYLTGVRKIKPQVLDSYRIGAKDGAVLLPAFTPDQSEIQYIKYRDLAAGKDRRYWSEAGGEPCLFGWQAIPPNERTVILAEGEIDALSWASYGFPALSPTNGCKTLGWIDYEFDRLARFDEIYISFDMDSPAQSAIPELVDRLGRERCRIVSLPRKDCNECLVAGDSVAAMALAIADAKTCDPDELVSARDYADDVVALFHPAGEEIGVKTPWSKGRNQFLFRPGEVVILPGINGHGKSLAAGQLTLEAMDQGWRCCVASMEFKPAKWLQRMGRQASVNHQPSEEYIRAIHRWYDGKLWAFNASGTAKAQRIISVFEYAARRYGIQWFVVDNLAKCGFAEDDYNGQKRFVESLGDFARDFDVIVILCAHMRKSDSEDKPLGKMDVKGSGAITDMADSVLHIWRNKKKEKQRRIAEMASEHSDAPIDFNDREEPDAVISCTKQRNGEDEPAFRLWFDRESHQYVEFSGARPRRYVPFSNAIDNAA